MKSFEIIEHTADIGIRAFGGDEKELFANAAIGMFSLIADHAAVIEAERFAVAVEAEDREELLVEWLNELLYLYDSRNVVLKRFQIVELNETHLRGEAFGEPIDPERHQLKIDIKAVTYHLLKVSQDDGCWQAEVIFDV